MESVPPPLIFASGSGLLRSCVVPNQRHLQSTQPLLKSESLGLRGVLSIVNVLTGVVGTGHVDCLT